MDNIKVMISSRCGTLIKSSHGSQSTLTEIRQQLEEEVEAENLLGEQLYELIISEEHTASSINNSWDECLKMVDDSHIVVAIYTGEGGWAKSGSDIGICHAELARAKDTAPAKLFVVDATNAVAQKGDTDRLEEVNQRFEQYIEQQKIYTREANTHSEIVSVVKSIIFKATVRMVDMGQREARRGKFNTGDALKWSRMNYAKLQRAITQRLCNTIAEDGNDRSGNSNVIFKDENSGDKILFAIHAIPDAMSVAAARELVGNVLP